MEAFAIAFGERLDELVAGYASALRDLPAEALDWVPGAEMNSLTVLATHAAAAVRYLIGDVAAGDPSGRVREQEFRTVGRSAEELMQRFAEVTAYAKEKVGMLSVADLGKENFSPQHNRNFTAIWCIFRALDHLAEHMAHAQLTRLMWEQRTATVR